MKKVKAIIVDDEQGCISNLKYYLNKYCPLIDVIETETSPENVPELLSKDFHVAFLDVEICKENIFDIISNANFSNKDIVFVTAYEQYALRAFDVQVLDYILKPLRKEDILNCYSKILRLGLTIDSGENNHETEAEKIIIRQRDYIYVVPYEEIVYFKAKGAYTEVCFYNNDLKNVAILSKSLSKLAQIENKDNFMRVHRSFIINLNKIKSISTQNSVSVEMCTDDIIQVAKRRIQDFLSLVTKV